ncbi:putative Polycomb group protein ASXL2 isoform X2 [Melanotaenia boesemani]|uniref:putative Polycomb group protein ASXL2 isoform X2 n=1 Tax=Melanotaenia boesemani TaxID=1250792 RepID=UPI001C04261E|nr:putative Polycomb group protein ASXL2 isoform X2 [Melanotaenia boesemani]
MRERQKKKKGRTWAEAAKTVLEKYPNTPMSHKEILQVIQRERLKEISGTSPLACLNAMLHTNSRGEEGIFYKVPGRMGVYTLKKDISDVVKELSEEGSDESSDNLSDSQSSENNSSAVTQEGRRGRWMRRVPSKLQSQPSSPQPRCSSPPVPTSKLISPSQKHSKKALKQALKQQQQRNQRRQGGMPAVSSPRLLLKTIKDMADNITTKTDLCHPVVPRKVAQRSSRLNAGQIKRTKYKIDVETPDSILVNTNLRAIINKHTFSVLPPDCQQKLLKLLPEVDRQACLDGLLKVTSSALNNEFFTSAAQSWKERLAEGEFTPELQLRMRQEIEKEKKVEQWKEAFFENYYGENSGLSYEESKELMKADLNLESPRAQLPPHQTRPVTQALEDTEHTKSSSQTDAAPKDTTTSQTSQELPKAHPRQKEAVSITEPMKTRRSYYAEDRKLNTAAQSGPASAARTPEVEKQTEQGSACAPPEREHKEDAKEEKAELPLSPVKKIPPLKATSELKEDPSVSEVKTAVESEDITSESSGPTEPLKRKSLSETEGELTPEKRSRLSSVSSVSSVSSASPSASSISSPATPSPTNQRVPPLKIPVSRILTVPVSPNQVSPRTPLPAPLSSPGRTGARTLADIKAKAQLARAQRAAAAAVSSALKGAVSSTGPGGGSSEQRQPSPSLSPSPTSPQASFRLPATSSNNSQPSTPSPCPVDSFGQLSPHQSQICYTGNTDDKLKGHSAGTFTAASHNFQKGLNASRQPSSSHFMKEQETPTSVGPLTRSSSCIPANNPLVTQLLQGKEVPLDQILPKPLSKVEVKISNVPSGSKVKTYSAEHRADKQMLQQFNTTGQAVGFSEYTKHHRELPDKETQEQILQALMQRKGQPSQSYGSMGPQPAQYKVHQMIHTEERRDQSRISVSFLGRKRIPRPAMTGHYLLNVSTYGRGPESKRLQVSVIPNKSVSSLKRESTEGEEVAKEEELSKNVPLSVSRVKTEQQGYSITNSDDITSFQHCSSIKTEPGSEDNAGGGDNISTSAKAKDASPFSQSHQQHLELRNTKQGNSEPYLTHTEPIHQRPTAFQTQRTFDNQEPVVASCYGGTISMSVPHTMNHNTASTTPSISSTEADSRGIHGSVMSFSVTVTTIPASHSLDHGNQGEPSPDQSFIEGSNIEDVQSKCYCRLKAMIMCKGCGAFCHDDCIGPSKLCVSCLVVR